MQSLLLSEKVIRPISKDFSSQLQDQIETNEGQKIPLKPSWACLQGSKAKAETECAQIVTGEESSHATDYKQWQWRRLSAFSEGRACLKWPLHCQSLEVYLEARNLSFVPHNSKCCPPNKAYLNSVAWYDDTHYKSQVNWQVSVCVIPGSERTINFF